MSLTKTEAETIQNVINRLRCTPIQNFHSIPGNTQHRESDEVRAALTGPAKIYLDTWVIGALVRLLPGEKRDPDTARRLSR